MKCPPRRLPCQRLLGGTILEVLETFRDEVQLEEEGD